jgi:alkylation response protein AidB-like acyl-CoA dehydrogenase
MNFSISPRVEDFRSRVGTFVEKHVMPLEADKGSYDTHENIRLDLLEQLRIKARAECLWCLQLKPETGGQGLGVADAMARLHVVNPEDIGLNDFGKPWNYFEREIGRWSRQYTESSSNRIAALDEILCLASREPAA